MNAQQLKEQALEEADNQWIEAIAVRWGEYTVTPQNPLGGTWPLSPGATRAETIDTHIKFLYDELEKLRSSSHG